MELIIKGKNLEHIEDLYVMFDGYDAQTQKVYLKLTKPDYQVILKIGLYEWEYFIKQLGELGMLIDGKHIYKAILPRKTLKKRK